VIQDDESIFTYRICKLSEYALYDDFQCMIVSHCKYIKDTQGLYLSLDPYDELGSRNEKDNFCFWGESIKVEAEQC